MSKRWLLLVLLTHGLCTTSLLAQDNKPIELPKDPRAAIAALPIQEHQADGKTVMVIDGATKKPIANADVITLDQVRSKEFQERAAALQEAMRARNIDRQDAPLYFAAWIGTRYQTNAQGIAKIPANEETMAVVMAGERVGRWAARMEGPVELFTPLSVTVKVTTSRERPARNVPVNIRTDKRFRTGTTSKTDSTGTCKIRLPDHMRGKELFAEALIATNERVMTAFHPDTVPAEGLQLRLPACGQVRFILYGEDERPSKTLKSAWLNWTAPANDSFGTMRYTSVQPTQLEADGALYSYVALDLDINIAASVAGLPEALQFAAKGPKREHEMIVVDGRMSTAPPIISFRVLDQQGQPIANEDLGRLCYAESRFDYAHMRTDANGLATLVFTKEIPDSIYVMRRSDSEGSDYRGAGVLKITELKPGKQTLGDLQLLDEPIIASGTLVDAQGKPIAGVWLTSKATIASGGSGGGSRSGQKWFFDHRVRTDDAGYFEMREVAAVDKPLRITVDDEQWTPLDDELVLHPGDTNEVLRVAKATQLEGELIGEMTGARLHVNAFNRDTSKKTRGQMTDGTFTFSKLPEGNYDITIGRNENYKIENVKSVPKGEAQDPRLRSDEWTKHFQWLETTVTDEDDKPLEGITVLYYVKSKNGRSGYGVRTDKSGKARRLSPSKNASIEVKQAGYLPQKFEQGLTDLTIKLQSIAPIHVELAGMPKLTDGVLAQAALVRADGLHQHMGKVHIKSGQVTLLPTTLGKCEMELTLDIPYRQDVARDVRQELRNAIRLTGIKFELTSSREPGEKKVFQLEQHVIDGIKACLDDVRSILKKNGK